MIAARRRLRLAFSSPFDTRPGGHRRFDVDEAVAAIRGEGVADGEVAVELPEPVPYVPVEPKAQVSVLAVVTAVEDADVAVYDRPLDVEECATETPVV